MIAYLSNLMIPMVIFGIVILALSTKIDMFAAFTKGAKDGFKVVYVFKALLKRTKISVDSAMSGPEALEMIKDNKYDIIFLDHMMPDMDGIETYKHMKELEENPNKDTTVIMLTANAIMGAKEEYLGIGFSDYLSKPVQAAKLEAMILKYLPEELVTKPDIS